MFPVCWLAPLPLPDRISLVRGINIAGPGTIPVPVPVPVPLEVDADAVVGGAVAVAVGGAVAVDVDVASILAAVGALLSLSASGSLLSAAGGSCTAVVVLLLLVGSCALSPLASDCLSTVVDSFFASSLFERLNNPITATASLGVLGGESSSSPMSVQLLINRSRCAIRVSRIRILTIACRDMFPNAATIFTGCASLRKNTASD